MRERRFSKWPHCLRITPKGECRMARSLASPRVTTQEEAVAACPKSFARLGYMWRRLRPKLPATQFGYELAKLVLKPELADGHSVRDLAEEVEVDPMLLRKELAHLRFSVMLGALARVQHHHPGGTELVESFVRSVIQLTSEDSAFGDRYMEDQGDRNAQYEVALASENSLAIGLRFAAYCGREWEPMLFLGQSSALWLATAVLQRMKKVRIISG